MRLELVMERSGPSLIVPIMFGGLPVFQLVPQEQLSAASAPVILQSAHVRA